MESEKKDVESVASDTDNETESIEKDPQKSPAPGNDSNAKHVVIETDNETESIDGYSRESSYDPEKGYPAEVNGRNDDWINLALLPVLLLLLALQASFLLSKRLIQGDDGMTASISLIASMAIGIAAMVILFQQIWAGKVRLRNNRRQNAQVSSMLRDNLSLVGIVFFCPFACLLDIFQSYTEISCGMTRQITDEYKFYVTDVTFCVLHIVFMTLELLFCVQFRRLVMDKNVSQLRRFCVKLSMTIVVAANIGLWFNVVLEETTNDGTSALTNDVISANDTVNSYEGCLWGTLTSAEEPIRRTLYPFSVEFSLLVLEYFASHLIFNKEHHEDEAEVEECVEPKSKVLTLSDRRASLMSISGKRQSLVFGVTSPLVTLFGVFSNLLYITLSFFSAQPVFGSAVQIASTIRNQQFMIFYWLLMIALMALGFASACKFKAGKGKLKGIDYVVMASAFGPFICFLIRIIVVAENIVKVDRFYDPTIVWLPEVLNLIQVLLQLPFMFFADGMPGPSEAEGRQPRWRIFKAVVMSVGLCNITLWLLDSVLLDLDLVASIFPQSSWPIIDGIFRPFSIFFRFNSFLILLRAFLR